MERQGAAAGERGWLLLRCSRLLRWVDVLRARTLADEAVALAGVAGDPALVACARYQRGQLACLAGDVAYGLPEVEVGAAAIAALSETDWGRSGSADTASRVRDGRGTVVVWRAVVGRYRDARELGERLVAHRAQGEAGRVAGVDDALRGLGDAYAVLGMPDEAAAMLDRAHDAFLSAGNHFLAAWTLLRELAVVALPYHAEDIARQRGLAQRAEGEWVRASGAVPPSIPPRFVRLPLLVLEGEWEEAEQLAGTASAEGRGHVAFRATALGHLAVLARLRGDAERARWAVREVLPAGSATVPGTVAFWDVATALQREAATLALDAGDPGTAQAWLTAHDRWLTWSGAVLGQSEGQALWAQYWRATGETAQARACAGQALTHASAPRQPLALLAAHRLYGELDTQAGRYDAAADHFDASLTLADACHAPYERALTLLALAGLRAAMDAGDAALRLLDAVDVICEPLGARPMLARADALRLSLAAPPRVAPAYPAGLSSREVEVLRLVARGLTNAQVAEELFLGARTVETHLRSIYNKLGVSTRAAATHFAVTNGIA
jgi:ATP/maltotriose-dependent transcriptional regulator MalT